MGKIITIYCEGKKGSHDYDILGKTIGDIAGTYIKPIGGKRGANAIIEFAETGTVKSDFYCMFRDRDFDASVPKSEKLISDGKKTYFSYRTTIENYLFDTESFLMFVKEKNLNTKYKITNETDVKNIFIEAAKEIKNYQAVRHTLGKLRFSNNFDTTWVKGGSGYLPEKLDLDTCKTEGWKLIHTVLAKSNTEWTKDTYQSVLDKFLEFFDENFFTELKFLIYFQGKDFAKVLKNKLFEFPIEDYYKFAKKRFEYKKFGDLVKFRQLIESKK
jgi:hypothetical protein